MGVDVLPFCRIGEIDMILASFGLALHSAARATMNEHENNDDDTDGGRFSRSNSSSYNTNNQQQ